jgi:hypothetical protein
MKFDHSEQSEFVLDSLVHSVINETSESSQGCFDIQIMYGWIRDNVYIKFTNCSGVVCNDYVQMRNSESGTAHLRQAALTRRI